MEGRQSKLSARADAEEKEGKDGKESRERRDKKDKDKDRDRDKDKDKDKGDKEKEKRGGSGRSRRESRLEGDVVDRPGSGSRPHSAKQHLLQEDLIDVTPGLRFTKRCVFTTVAMSSLVSLLLGAAIFYLIYYLAALMNFCPWTKLETGCYQFFQDFRNWTSAATICAERGGRLAELEGFDKQVDVEKLFRIGNHKPACFWIGAYESDPDDLTFSWYTSGLLTRKYYTNWEDGHPKNRSVTTCVDFCHPDFLWKNKRCNLEQNYLCEYG